MTRIGVDFGGTKIEAAALDSSGTFIVRRRVPAPTDYETALLAVAKLIQTVEAEAGPARSVGIGLPGSISPKTGVMRNANATHLNGRRIGEDLERALGRPIRLANDANCLALSEAYDGAAAGSQTIFAVVIGTGCGGGIVVNGRLVIGASGIAGEWGHIPLPWPRDCEIPAPACWCGLSGCVEKWISGTGFGDDYHRRSGLRVDGREIIARAHRGEDAANQALDSYVDRLGRALALIVNVIDPDCIVLGGGMSNVSGLYERLSPVIDAYAFSDSWQGMIVPAKWGDSSGVRGAARLWNG